MNVKVEVSKMIEESSVEELTEIRKAIDIAIDQRQTERFYELADRVIDAIKCLQKEFPCAQCLVEHTNCEDVEEEVDFLDFEITKRNFVR